MSPQGNTPLYISEKGDQFDNARKGVSLYRPKSTVRPHIFAIVAWCSLFLLVSGVALKVIYLSCELEEQRRLVKINQELVQQLIKTHATANGNSQDKINNDDIIKSENIVTDKKSSDVTKDESENLVAKSRSKRSPSVRKRDRRHSRRRPVTSCHLEGKRGPEIYSRYVPKQRPRNKMESILWKEPDSEPHSICTMETRLDTGKNGVRYIRIQTEGFYHVYSQVTYETRGQFAGGHTVDVTSTVNGVEERKTLLTSRKAPWKEMTPTKVPVEESSYTAGVFYLQPEELLSVHTTRGGMVTVMNDDKSFFGVYYLGP